MCGKTPCHNETKMAEDAYTMNGHRSKNDTKDLRTINEGLTKD